MTTELTALAKAGDESAFRALVDPYRRELHLHCYRILGSMLDAEDALQETLLAAWRSLAGFEERASIRTWLYTVATSRALNLLRAAKRRPNVELPLPERELPEPTTLGEPVWLEPYPDVLLDDTVDAPPGPEARYEAKEAVSLAFVTALQLLPARQRAALILRDVLGFHATEVAQMLDSTVESVTSALKRARATIERELPRPEPPLTPGSPAERELVDRLTSAFEDNDMDAVVALLADDVRLSMPPLPIAYLGRDAAARFLTVIATHRRHRRRILHTRANGQPALAVYAPDASGELFRSVSFLVITVAGARVGAITRFDPSVLSHFGLPRTLPG